MISNFQEKTTHLLEFSIASIVNKVKGANFPQDAALSTSVEDQESNTQLPTVSTTSQRYTFGKTINLDSIIYHTRKYPAIIF